MATLMSNCHRLRLVSLMGSGCTDILAGAVTAARELSGPKAEQLVELTHPTGPGVSLVITVNLLLTVDTDILASPPLLLSGILDNQVEHIGQVLVHTVKQMME
uniref:Uncharacterized protein n=1 Tax=Cacopsylla melanoneura TaxID=428564 RepID=A0A8D8VX38_9HEMI